GGPPGALQPRAVAVLDPAAREHPGAPEGLAAGLAQHEALDAVLGVAHEHDRGGVVDRGLAAVAAGQEVDHPGRMPLRARPCQVPSRRERSRRPAPAAGVRPRCVAGWPRVPRRDVGQWWRARQGTRPRKEAAAVLIEHILHRKGRDVVTIGADAPVADAVARLRDHNVGALVVTDDGDRVVGIISERDVVRSLAGDDPAAVLGAAVRDLMSTDLTTCGPSATVAELMRLMTERRIRHIPVMDGDRLAGIISIGDVVKSRIDELQAEAEALHEYLTSGR